MARIFAATRGPEGWQNHLGDPDRHWRAGFSAMSTARCWEHWQEVPPEIAALLGRQVTLQLALVEHKVPLPGSTLGDTQCDVFALVRADGRDVALAVEAKVDEPFGPTVGDWLDGAGQGKLRRLAALCDLLDTADPPDGDLRYQLFHRTAAAVIEARRFHRPVAAMVVQSFSPGGRWRDDFLAFAAGIGAPVGADGTGRKRLRCGIELVLGWAAGEQRFREPLPAATAGVRRGAPWTG